MMMVNGETLQWRMYVVLLLGLTQHTLGKLGSALGELGSALGELGRTAVGADNNHVQGM